MTEEQRRREVRQGYAKMASTKRSCRGDSTFDKESKKIGYSQADLKTVPEGANMGLGCGNPVALASLRALAAKRVGGEGRIIGVDMTPEMIDKVRENARKGKYSNVEFRLGEIENLPAADNTADVIISNCVINLTPNKKKVFQEAFRVLKQGGRLMISDLVLSKDLPREIKKVLDPTSCITGAILKDEYLKTIKSVGFENVRINQESHYNPDIADDPDTTVQILNAKTNTVETKKMSELNKKEKQRMEETLKEVSSISVSATKP